MRSKKEPFAFQLTASEQHETMDMVMGDEWKDHPKSEQRDDMVFVLRALADALEKMYIPSEGSSE